MSPLVTLRFWSRVSDCTVGLLRRVFIITFPTLSFWTALIHWKTTNTTTTPLWQVITVHISILYHTLGCDLRDVWGHVLHLRQVRYCRIFLIFILFKKTFVLIIWYCLTRLCFWNCACLLYQRMEASFCRSLILDRWLYKMVVNICITIGCCFPSIKVLKEFFWGTWWCLLLWTFSSWNK